MIILKLANNGNQHSILSDSLNTNAEILQQMLLHVAAVKGYRKVM